ncbi:MAG: nucleotide exchange factor GrpE [Pirellulales bacterium]
MSESNRPTDDLPDYDDAAAETFPLDAEQPGADLADQLKQSQDRVLRAQAELENFRKRVYREQDEERKYRETSLLTDLLPVLDNVERALAAGQKTADAAVLLQGFEMLGKQLDEVMSKHNCKRIDAQGKPFDPNVHQAIMQQSNGEVDENTVLLVAATGYTVHDRTIRPAQVIVSKKP